MSDEREPIAWAISGPAIVTNESFGDDDPDAVAGWMAEEEARRQRKWREALRNLEASALPPGFPS